MFLELVNFLLVVTTDNLNDLIQNATALVIIADADIILYATLRNEILKEILKCDAFQAVALTVARTTSSQMRKFNEEEDSIKEDSLVLWKIAHPQVPASRSGIFASINREARDVAS